MEGPLGNQPVTAVPGIDDAAQRNLGMTRAFQLLEMYLQNPLTFQTTLMETFEVHVDNAILAYNALRDVSRINFAAMALYRVPLVISKKYTALTCMEAPLGETPVTAIPGIGRGWKRVLNRRGITRASQLLEMCLQNPSTFQQTLKNRYGVYAHHAGWAYNALCDFSRRYIFEH